MRRKERACGCNRNGSHKVTCLAYPPEKRLCGCLKRSNHRKTCSEFVAVSRIQPYGACKMQQLKICREWVCVHEYHTHPERSLKAEKININGIVNLFAALTKELSPGQRVEWALIFSA